MDIRNPCVVSLTWRLEDAQGELIDELNEPMEFFFGGDDLLSKVEEALMGQSTGFEAALQDLSDKARQAFLLHYLEGAPHGGIAAALGVSTRMVHKYLVQALVCCHQAVDA